MSKSMQETLYDVMKVYLAEIVFYNYETDKTVIVYCFTPIDFISQVKDKAYEYFIIESTIIKSMALTLYSKLKIGDVNRKIINQAGMEIADRYSYDTIFPLLGNRCFDWTDLKENKHE